MTFDTVIHKILRDKFNHHLVIRGILLLLFHSYLSNCKQFMKTEHLSSTLVNISKCI